MKKIIFFFLIFISLFFINCPADNQDDDSGDSNDQHNPVTPDDTGDDTKISGLNALELETENQIDLEWINAAGFNALSDNYKIYRYKPDANNENLDLDTFIDNITSNPFIDNNSILINQPYFYKIKFVKNGVEGSFNDNYEFGLCTDIIDQYEDKKSILDIEGDGVGTFPALYTGDPALDQGWADAVIYSCKDGRSGLVKDVDFFKCRKPDSISIIFFEIKLDDETDFEDGDICFREYYKNNPSDSAYVEGIEKSCAAGGGIFSTGFMFTFTGDTEEVFFKVYVKADKADTNIVEKYKVRFCDSF